MHFKSLEQCLTHSKNSKKDCSHSRSPAMQGHPSLIPGSGRSPGEGIGYALQYFWASLVGQLVRIRLQCGRPGFNPWVWKIPWRRERLPTPVLWPGAFHGLYGIAKSRTQLSNFHSPISFPSHPSRLIQSPRLSFLRHTANSHWLSILHMAIYFSFMGRALYHWICMPQTLRFFFVGV